MHAWAWALSRPFLFPSLFLLIYVYMHLLLKCYACGLVIASLLSLKGIHIHIWRASATFPPCSRPLWDARRPIFKFFITTNWSSSALISWTWFIYEPQGKFFPTSSIKTTKSSSTILTEQFSSWTTIQCMCLVDITFRFVSSPSILLGEEKTS